MKVRADARAKEEYPFGSEMAWDSTGQEEVYNCYRYFGYEDQALVSLDSIVGYASHPALGQQRKRSSLLGFPYAAKLTRIERQIHHYGSGLNAIPMRYRYRSCFDL